MQTLFGKIRIYFGLLLFVLIMSFSKMALGQSATITGQIADGSGAALKDTTITLLNKDTHVQIVAASDANGIFILPPVVPGHYKITVTAAGFSPWVAPDVILEIGQTKVVNAVLTVGEVNQAITVTDTPAELQMENADRSTLLEPTLVANSPLDPRNPLQLINHTVGVTMNDAATSGTNNTTESTTNQYRINGAKYETTDILIDGGADVVAYNNQAAGIPGVDSTSEFRVLTTAYAPEYGNTSGGIVSMSLKSGSNTLHGGAWEYFRNQLMDANGYNANLAGLQRPDLERNQFGGQLGGPIVFGKLYNGHNKTFFFASYEALRDTYVPPGGFTALIPTTAMLKGDFTVATNGSAATSTSGATGAYPIPGNIYDPTNIAGGKRAQFSCNGVANVICPSRIDPVGQKLLSMFPSSQVQSSLNILSNGGYNYVSNATEGDIDNSGDLRIDHQINDKHTIFGHFARFSNYINNPNVWGSAALSNGQEPTNSNDRIPGYHILVDHSWTLNNDLIFNHHFSWGHSESNRASSSPLSPSSIFGMNAAAAPDQTNTFTPQIEAVSGQLNATLGGASTSAMIGNSEPLEINKSSVYQYQADISWLKGRHIFKAGGDIRRFFVQHYDPVGITLTGGKSLTGGPTPSTSQANGNAIAELLLGFTPVKSGYAPRVTERDMAYFVYGEDTYKVTRKLTATYGVRYGIIGSWVTDGNMLNYLDLTSPSPIAVAAGMPNLVGGVGIPGISIPQRNLQKPNLLHIEPRLGISYELDENTVIHAGYGIFRHPQAAEASYSEMAGFIRNSTSVSSFTAAGSAVNIEPGTSTSSPGYYTLGNPFWTSTNTGGAPPAPYGNNPVAGLPGNNIAGGPLSIELGQGVSGDLRAQTGPYQEIASVDVQRALPSHFVVTLGAINNQGVRLRSGINLNQLSDTVLSQCLIADPSGNTCAPLSNAVANPFYKIINDPASVLSASTVQAGYLQRAYPQFTTFEPIDVGWGHSSYNALQATFSHREARGFSMLLGYTYSKAIDQNSDSSSGFTIQDNGCHRCERSVSEQNSTHVFTENTMYELPFGYHGMWLNHGVAAALAGGWQIGTAFQFSSGLPVQLTQSTTSATTLIGNIVYRPTVVPGVSLTPAPGTNQVFNPAAFTKTPAYEFGNASRYQSKIHAPNYMNLDAFVQKETRLRGEMGFTLRFEALNATNYVVFAAPFANISNANFGTKQLSQINNPREAQISARFSF